MATETQRDDARSGEMAGIDAQIAEVAAEIAEVKGNIAGVEAALSGGEPRLYLGRERSMDYLDQRLAAFEKEKDRLREEKTDLQRQKTALLARQQPAAPGLHFFLVRACVKGSHSITGIRPLLYEGDGPTGGIRHDVDGNLQIRLAFETKQTARSFETGLHNLNMGERVVQLKGSVFVESPLLTMSGSVGDAAERDHYDPDASTSPTTTLADMAAVPHSATSASRVKDQEPLFVYQSLEDPDIGRASKFERARIKDQALCADDEKRGENNQLALSPTRHQCFDGDGFAKDGTAKGTYPSIAIRSGVVSDEEEMVEYGGKKRRRVELFIKCNGSHVVKTVQPNLKAGTESQGEGIFRTTVLVENPPVVVQMLQWKYERVKRVWAMNNSMKCAKVTLLSTGSLRLACTHTLQYECTVFSRTWTKVVSQNVPSTARFEAYGPPQCPPSRPLEIYELLWSRCPHCVQGRAPSQSRPGEAEDWPV